MRAAKVAFPGFDTPAAGFEVPLEMLAACHGRVEFYRSHIAREEAELLPLVARLLGEARLDAVGRSMRIRRGIRDV